MEPFGATGRSCRSDRRGLGRRRSGAYLVPNEHFFISSTHAAACARQTDVTPGRRNGQSPEPDVVGRQDGVDIFALFGGQGALDSLQIIYKQSTSEGAL